MQKCKSRNLAAEFPFLQQPLKICKSAKVETWPPSFHLALFLYFVLPVLHFRASERSLAEFQKCVFSTHWISYNTFLHVGIKFWFPLCQYTQASSTNGHLAKKSLWVSSGVRSFGLVAWRHYDVTSSCPASSERLSNYVHGSRLFNAPAPILLDSVLHVVGITTNLRPPWWVRLSLLAKLLPSQWLV